MKRPEYELLRLPMKEVAANSDVIFRLDPSQLAKLVDRTGKLIAKTTQGDPSVRRGRYSDLLLDAFHVQAAALTHELGSAGLRKRPRI